MSYRRRLLNFGERSTDVRIGFDDDAELPRIFASAVGKPCRALLLSGADVDSEYLQVISRSLIDAGYTTSNCVLSEYDCSRFSSTSMVFDALSANNITKDDVIVAIGDSRVCSMAALCSELWFASPTLICVPTTLDAMVTCSTSTDLIELDTTDSSNCVTGVSIESHASLVICNLRSVQNSSLKQASMGFVRIVAAALSDSKKTWTDFADRVEALYNREDIALIEALSMALNSRLNTVKSVSPAARNAFLYGQTTAHALKQCLADEVPEHALLAEGMRFEARLAVDVHDLPADVVFDQDDYLETLGINELTFDLDPCVFVDELKKTRSQYSNRFQLALPKHTGIIRLSSVDDETLMRHAKAFTSTRKE